MPWLAVFLFALLSVLPVLADENPRISTKSHECCEELFARLAASPLPVTAVSRELGEDGRRLCANGHLRTGIAKLRRAPRGGAEHGRGRGARLLALPSKNLCQASRRATIGMTSSALRRRAETFGSLGSRHKPRRPSGRKTCESLPAFWCQQRSQRSRGSSRPCWPLHSQTCRPMQPRPCQSLPNER